MQDKVIDIAAARRLPQGSSDFWFAQIDARLARIETMIARLERQLWLAMGLGAVLAAAQLVTLV